MGWVGREGRGKGDGDGEEAGGGEGYAGERCAGLIPGCQY